VERRDVQPVVDRVEDRANRRKLLLMLLLLPLSLGQLLELVALAALAPAQALGGEVTPPDVVC